MADIERLPLTPSTTRDSALAELEHLSGLVDRLSLSDWSRQSAVEGWTIGDVVAHLDLLLGLYGRLMGVVLWAGGSGHVAKPIGWLTEVVMPATGPLFDQVNGVVPRIMNRIMSPEVVKRQFAAGARKTRACLARVGPDDGARSVSLEGEPYPLSFYLAITVNELAIHGGDIASVIEGGADLSDDARRIRPWFYWHGTTLMLHLPKRTTGTIQVRLSEPASAMWWSISNAGAARGGQETTPNPDATIRGLSGPHVLTLAGRLKLTEVLPSSLTIEGDRSLAERFRGSWRLI